jgi:hypothetical protein
MFAALLKDLENQIKQITFYLLCDVVCDVLCDVCVRVFRLC